MKTIKGLVTDNWLPKLFCLLLAIGVWFAIRQDMNKETTAPYGSEIIRSHP